MKTLTERPTNDELLELYALFKQGSVGDNDTGKLASCSWKKVEREGGQGHGQQAV